MTTQEFENRLVTETDEERKIRERVELVEEVKWLSGWSVVVNFLNDNMKLFVHIVKEKEGVFQEFLEYVLEGYCWRALDELYDWMLMYRIQSDEEIIKYLEQNPLGVLCSDEHERDYNWIGCALTRAYKKGNLLELAQKLEENRTGDSQLAKFQRMSNEQLLSELTHKDFYRLHSKDVGEYIVKRLEKIYL